MGKQVRLSAEEIIAMPIELLAFINKNNICKHPIAVLSVRHLMHMLPALNEYRIIKLIEKIKKEMPDDNGEHNIHAIQTYITIFCSPQLCQYYKLKCVRGYKQQKQLYTIAY